MTETQRSGLAPRPSATGKERITALDGLRAVALLIIMGYHFGVGWLQGGFFSLDIFYVLSGYLITGLLVSEYRTRSAIKLSAFWLRRARRLLPALAIVLVAVTLMVRYAEPAGLYPDFRLSALSALFYFSNWWQIAASGNYFVATGAVSPLTHTWSLAVEEQFYLVWPLVVLTLMYLARSFARGIRILLVFSAVGAVASALEMALLYNPRANTTRLYFGTDTHAQSILVGAVMACAMTWIQMRRGHDGMAPVARSSAARAVLVFVGLAGLAGTFTLTYLQDGTSSFDYRGGFFLSALSAAAIIIGAICVPSGVIARFLSLRPLVWLGTISYGAYLWHYPVYVYLDASRTGQIGLALLAIRFAATIALAAASYYLVERRVMYGTFWRSLKAVVPASAAMVATVAVIVAGTVVPAVAAAPVGHFRAPPAQSTPPPARLVVLGDSTAYTLGFALAATAPAGTTVQNSGLFGCGLVEGTYASNNPPQPELAMFPACNVATPVSQQWPALDTKAVADTAPGDIVLFVAGSWEAQDVLRNGQWWNIQQPADRRYIVAQMRKAVEIGTAHGAHFDFTTMPALASGAAFNEAPLPEDSATRRLLYDSLIKKVAAQFPGQVSVIDYGAILSPHGIYTQDRDGVQVRTPDGIHTPAYAPGNVFAGNSTEAVAHAFYDWLSPRLWPLIIATNPVSASVALPEAERQALTTAGAFTGKPITFLLLGDSLAASLHTGLTQQSVNRYGVRIIDESALGCDLDDLPAIVDGNIDQPESTCRTWRTLWAQQVAQFRPDVVGLLVGRWDITNHIDDGQIVHIGQPAWDAHLQDELTQAVGILAGQGAKVVLFTMPYIDPPESANGISYPENSPARVTEFNQILAAVARSRPGVATLIDLNRELDPGGSYRPVIDGVTVRWADGIHISEAGGVWLQPFILPTVAQVGLSGRSAPAAP
jgi:peptidoglycan/LPS O-acetylase OafA/YrhL